MIEFKDALNFKLKSLMKQNKKIICFGLGIDDPKRIFGTTSNLKEEFGSNRVFDTPVSENAMTGIGLGLALNNFIPIISHQRLDFFLLSMDQLVNNISKWRFMFGLLKKFTIIFRLIIGRGWGQGPTHSQNLQSWFAHIPGLIVVAPTFPSDVVNLLELCVKSNKPCIIIEHRWLHNIKEKKIKKKKIKFGQAKIIKKGNDLTIISHSYSTIEIQKIYPILFNNLISIEHIDLISLKPLDMKTIYKSVKKTSKLIIFDNTSHPFCSIGSEIISQLMQKDSKIFSKTPRLITLPDIPSPTSHILIKKFYKSSYDLISEIEKILNKKIKYKKKDFNNSDVQDNKFLGPF